VLNLSCQPLKGVSGVALDRSSLPHFAQQKSSLFGLLFVERKTRLELAFKYIDNQTITIANKVALQM
jgi:hypothetical protein